MTNPFAEIDRFEELRAAALDGDDAFDRYQRKTETKKRMAAIRQTELKLHARTKRMLDVSLASSRAILLVGPPGTGKTQILQQLVARANDNPDLFGIQSRGIDAYWVTPEEEWTFDSLVLGETLVDGEIQSVEGDLLQAIRNDLWLILDEANRADLDRVLGGVLTWLSGNRVKVGTWKTPGRSPSDVYLTWSDNPETNIQKTDFPAVIEYAVGTDWRILGTYNATDALRVFRMGQALSRRFKHIPIPPVTSLEFSTIIAGHISEDSIRPWLQDRITSLYEAHLMHIDTNLGPGLFVDIPKYVEHGLRMEGFQFEPAAEEHQFGEDIGSFSRVAEPVNADLYAVGTRPPKGLLEDLLTEAYLLSAGNQISKYEPELLSRLGSTIVNKGILSSESWSWFSTSLESLRA